MELFDEYLRSDKVSEAILVGRNLVNKDPANQEMFRKYEDLLISLAEKLPAFDERKSFASQAEVTLAFFEENAEMSVATVALIGQYRDRISEIVHSITEEEELLRKKKYDQIISRNNEIIKQLHAGKSRLEKASDQKRLDAVLEKIGALDAQLDHDALTEEQRNHYNQLNRDCSALISQKMIEIERMNNITYNKRAVEAFEKAFRSFKTDESKYKNQTQLFGLVSTTLFAYDASKLFNETLIYYNHVYSYIFGKLDDDGKLALTRYSIECERKLR